MELALAVGSVVIASLKPFSLPGRRWRKNFIFAALIARISRYKNFFFLCCFSPHWFRVHSSEGGGWKRERKRRSEWGATESFSFSGSLVVYSSSMTLMIRNFFRHPCFLRNLFFLLFFCSTKNSAMYRIPLARKRKCSPKHASVSIRLARFTKWKIFYTWLRVWKITRSFSLLLSVLANSPWGDVSCCESDWGGGR